MKFLESAQNPELACFVGFAGIVCIYVSYMMFKGQIQAILVDVIPKVAEDAAELAKEIPSE